MKLNYMNIIKLYQQILISFRTYFRFRNKIQYILYGCDIHDIEIF